MALNKLPSKLFFFFILTTCFVILPPYTTTTVIAAAAPNKPSIDRLFQFGDSLSDTGNLIRYDFMGADSVYSRLPYGKTLGVPTGRCSDGLLMVDYLANFFRLPHLNPYLDQQANFSHGVNFAMAGATAVDNSILRYRGIIPPSTSISLSTQLDWFKSHLNSLCGTDSECKRRVVRNSLVLMGEIGGGDYNTALLEGYSLEVVYQLVPLVVGTIKEGVKQVIDMGATSVVVPGILPIGCMPVYLTYYQQSDPRKYDVFKCLTDLNNFAKFHNDQLLKAIKELQRGHPGVAIVYGDYYSGLRWILRNAHALGFDTNNLYKKCCGSDIDLYNQNLGPMCGYDDVVCASPDQRLSWDGMHLTQHANLHMVQFLIVRSIAAGIFRWSP